MPAFLTRALRRLPLGPGKYSSDDAANRYQFCCGLHIFINLPRSCGFFTSIVATSLVQSRKMHARNGSHHTEDL